MTTFFGLSIILFVAAFTLRIVYRFKKPVFKGLYYFYSMLVLFFIIWLLFMIFEVGPAMKNM
jgi:hypothetical protein